MTAKQDELLLVPIAREMAVLWRCARIPELRARAADAGRNINVYVMFSQVDPAGLDACEGAGVSRVLLWLPSAGQSLIERQMDAFDAALATRRGE